MHATSRDFKENARAAINDATLQRAMTKLGFQAARAAAVSRLPEFDKLRDQARDIKNHVLENLDLYLERYESEMTRRGGQLHWCRTAEEACNTVLEICRRFGAKTVMVFGFSVSTLGILLLTQLSASSSYLSLFAPLNAAGSGFIQLHADTLDQGTGTLTLPLLTVTSALITSLSLRGA